MDSDERLTVADANGGLDYLIDTESAALYGIIYAPVELTTFEDEKNATYWTEAEVVELQGTEPTTDDPPKTGFLFTRILKYGMRGEDVCELKRLLASAGFGGLTLGNANFYSKTKQTVKAFQKAKALTVDGKAGPQTITALGGVWDA